MECYANIPQGILWEDALHNVRATGIILCMCPANERWRYDVTSSLIGWAHAQNNSWVQLEANMAAVIISI